MEVERGRRGVMGGDVGRGVACRCRVGQRQPGWQFELTGEEHQADGRFHLIRVVEAEFTVGYADAATLPNPFDLRGNYIL